MGFAQEMKDFSAGMKSAGDFWDKRADRKLKEAKADQYKITDEDYANTPNTFTGSGGSGLMDAPKGGVAPVHSDDTDETDPNGYRRGITGIESGGRYDALGPVTDSGDRAYGKYQIMGANVPIWTKEALGTSMTPDQFLADKDAQNRTFDYKFGQYADKYGAVGAAQAWLGGEGSIGKTDRTDQLGTSVGKYGDMFAATLKRLGKTGEGGTATAAAPKSTAGASAGVLPTGDDGDGDDSEGSGDDDTGVDETEQSQAQQAQPVQTAQAAPAVPVPQQTAMPAPTAMAPSQFASVQGSGFGNAPSQASMQPSQQAQPPQMAAQQPRTMNQGAGVSRVADAMMTPEEQARQRALQGGALFADKGGAIPENIGTPTIQQYYAEGGKVAKKSTSEWLYDHLPDWLTGEDFGNTVRETERGLGRETQGRAVPLDQKEKAGPPAPPPETAAQRVSRTSKPVIPERGQKEDVPAPAIPPPETVSQQVSGSAPVPSRPQKELPPEVPPPDISRRRQEMQTMTSGPREPPPAGPAPPPAPIATDRRQQEIQDMTSGPRQPPRAAIPPDRPTKDDTIEQEGPPLPTAAGAPQQGPVIPPGAHTTVPVTSGAARAAATPQELPPPEDDYDPLKNWAGMDDPGGLDANARRSSRFEGTEPQTPSNPAFIEPGYKGAIPTPEPAEKQGPQQPGQVGLVDALKRAITPAPAGPEKMGPNQPINPRTGQPIRPAAPAEEPTGPLPEVQVGNAMDPGATGAAGNPQEPVQPEPPAEETVGAIPVPGERPANPINGEVPIPQERPERPPAAPVTKVAAAGRTAPAPTTRHAPQPVQPAPAGGQGRMLNAGSQSPRIYGGSTAAQVRDSRPAHPRYLVQQQGHDNPRTVAVASVGAHHGLDFIRHIFGFDGSSNEAIPSGGGGNQVGARRFINGAGAATPQDNAAIERIAGIDPNLPDPIKHLERLSKVTQVYMARGMPKEAKAAAASQLLYGADQVSKLGSLSGASYQEYLQTGNPAALQHTLEYIAQAHAYIPSGESFNVYVDPQTQKIIADVTDVDGQHERHEITSQELPQIINATKDKSAYWRGVEAVADPAAARARISREATDARSKQTQERQDARQKAGFEHTDANLAETRRRQDEKDAKKAAADAAKQEGKTVNRAKVMPMVNRYKQAQAAGDQHAADVAASELYDAIPDGYTKKDEFFLSSTGLGSVGDFTYVPPEERGAPAAGGEAAPQQESTSDYYYRMGQPGLAPPAPAAAASKTATPQRPAGVPPEANYSPSKKGWVVKNPNGGYDVVGT